jgi:hypothetical protein
LVKASISQDRIFPSRPVIRVPPVIRVQKDIEIAEQLGERAVSGGVETKLNPLPVRLCCLTAQHKPESLSRKRTERFLTKNVALENLPFATHSLKDWIKQV